MIYRNLAAWILATGLCVCMGCTQEKAPASQPSNMPNPAELAQPSEQNAADSTQLPSTNPETAQLPAPSADTAKVPVPSADTAQAPVADCANDGNDPQNCAKIPDDMNVQVQADGVGMVPSADNPGASEPDTNTAEVQETPDQNVNFEDQKTLTDAQKSIIQNITWDVDPEVLNAVKAENEGQHFLRSDERHPELFYDHIKDLGHTYIGIGTDQGYVFVGWQRPTLAFMVDYDPWVIVLHRVYFAFFKECEDAECLLGYFEDRDKGMNYLKEREGLNDKLTLTVYKEAQKGVTHSLRSIRRLKQKTFMNDPETYQYIRQMIFDGRMTTFQANLLGDRAFASIQSALNSIGASVGVLYLSNAENYWAYTNQYKQNMLNLPYSDNAMIIRTIATKPYNADYRYSVQKAEVFKAWLEHPDTKSVKSVVSHTKIKDPEDIPITVDNRMPN